MANDRLALQMILETLLGSRNVYFQPPENLKIKYPCIVYELSKIEAIKANNEIYRTYKLYTITIIHSDPDNTLKDEILNEFMYCTFDRSFKVDNLYHYVYDLYY